MITRNMPHTLEIFIFEGGEDQIGYISTAFQPISLNQGSFESVFDALSFHRLTFASAFHDTSQLDIFIIEGGKY